MDTHINNDTKTITRTTDPVQYLPSEISISIIRAALPQDGTYPAHLVDFADVSDNWRTLLLSTPILWSQLYLDEMIPDFLALLALSIKLSGQTPLTLAILGRSIQNWAGVCALVRPVYHRVIHIAVTRVPAPISECLRALSTLFDHLGHPPNLIQLISDEYMRIQLSRFDFFKFASTVQLIGKFELEYPIFPDNKNAFRLFNSVKYGSFGTALSDMRLFPLALDYNPYETSIRELMTVAKVPADGDLASYLEKCSCFEQLIFQTSSNLTRLHLVVKIIDLRDLFDCLRVLPVLQELYLSVSSNHRSPYPELTPSRTTYSGLKLLDVGLLVEEQDHDLLSALFDGLLSLYPQIEDFRLSAQSWPSRISTYLEYLPDLLSMRLNLVNLHATNPGSSINLSSLKSLTVFGTSVPHVLTMPKLLELIVHDGFAGARLSNLNALQLRTLVFQFEQRFDADSDEFNRHCVEFDSQLFPNLVELHLILYGSLPRVQFSSFSQLVIIHLRSRWRFINPIGTCLYLHFIYHPEHCPMLQELHSDRCSEWDFLFLMLERRNFGLTGVKRIHTAISPWVPFTLRSHLARLLAGESVEESRPALPFLEETLEVLFDPSIPGCYSCVKNERSGCSAEIISNSMLHKLQSSDAIYPELDIPPVGIPPEVHRQLVQHEVSVGRWKESYEACSFRREDTCHRWWL